MVKRKILLKNNQCPGDILMLTAAVRDLYVSHFREIEIRVDTTASAIWENNPYLSNFSLDDSTVEKIECTYPLIHTSNNAPYHFVHAFRKELEEKLGLEIPPTLYHGDVHLSKEEKSWQSQIEDMGVKQDFWIIMAGGKNDYSAKWWSPDSYQKVVDHFKGRILFVQCGEANHWHPPLKGVINLIGKTDLRQYIRLMYHSIGVVCPVTFAMHAAAAIPTRPNHSPSRACVVIAGGREPAQWEQYPNQRYLSTNGSLTCCAKGGCWKSRCQTIGDGDAKDNPENLCLQPVRVSQSLQIPRCMEMIKPFDVIRAIESYYDGDMYHYNS
jgi:ADP-heptose:LPS heptosyltransferase